MPKLLRTETIYSKLLYTEAVTQGRLYTGRLLHRVARAETKSAVRHTGDPCSELCGQRQNLHLTTCLGVRGPRGQTEFTFHQALGYPACTMSAEGCRSQFWSHPDGRRRAQPPEEKNIEGPTM